jgi:hypothetical protein
VCAGEFTLRAFLNGRLDLAQAESVAQVVAAKTSAAAETALAGIQVVCLPLKTNCTIKGVSLLLPCLLFPELFPELNCTCCCCCAWFICLS